MGTIEPEQPELHEEFGLFIRDNDGDKQVSLRYSWRSCRERGGGRGAEPPIEYMSNGRATFAICKLCGAGLRGFKNDYNTMENAAAHLYANHEGWDQA